MCVEMFELFGVGMFLALLIMSILWGVYLLKKNVAIVDIGWALSFFFIGWAYFILGDGFFLKRLLMLIMVTAWAGRLSWHLIRRFDIDVEDPRYTTLKGKFGAELIHFKMYLMFLFQGFLVVILSLPFLIVAGYSTSDWHTLEGLGILIWAGGLWGETIADHQFDLFKRNPENKGKVCQEGLWNYSRHPNYFFEWVVWIGFFCFAFPSPEGWFAVASPIIILLFLTQISGIPLAEEQALKTKGDAYRAYQKKTSAFIPWFK